MKDSTTPPQDEQKVPSPAPNTGWQRTFLFLRNSFLFLFILLLIQFLLLQLPIVQQFLAQKIVDSLETTLENPVRLEKVHVRWLDEIDLTNLYIEDNYGDTLLASGRVTADFNLNPIAIIRRGIEVEAVSISGARFNIRRDLGDSLSNLQLALLKLSPGKKEQKEGGVPINLKELKLNDVYFSQRDSIKGSFLGVELPAGKIYVHELDLNNNCISVNSVNLQSPIVKMDNWIGEPDLAQLDSILLSAIDTNTLKLSIEEFRLEGGQFEMHNYRKAPVKTTPATQLDLKHLDLFDIHIEIDSFQLEKDVYSGRVNWIAAKDRSGFKLDRLSSKEAIISDRQVVLNGLSIITPTSSLGDTLVFKYRSFDDWEFFEEKVRMDARFNDADITLKDIMAFVPKLNDNVFFNNNRNTNLQIDGRIRGAVNNLRGKKVKISLADGTRLSGNFSSQNLAVKNEEFLILELQRLNTRVSTLRQLIPNFQAPPNFDKLGRLNFSGRFIGFFVDFVADGKLNTDLGNVTVDMQMQLADGPNSAHYSGNIDLNDFDLAQWTDNPDFGFVNFSSDVDDGYGLTGDIAEANLTADIQSFDFKGYSYENATLTGRLNRNFFNGDLSIRDENIDLNFTGELDFRDSIAKFDFKADVNRLALLPLNLSKEDLRLSGKVDLNLTDTQFSTMEGEMNLNNILLQKGELERYDIKYIKAYSFFDPQGEKVFRLDSDIARGEIRGAFDINELPGSLKLFVLRNYPGFASRMKIKPPKRTPDVNKFSFDFHLNDSKGLNLLVDPKLGQLQDVDINGLYNGNTDSLLLFVEVPGIEYNKLRLVDVFIKVDALENEGNIDLVIDSTIINGKPRLNTLTLLSWVESDTLDFGLNISTDTPNLFDQVNLSGLLYLPDSIDYALKLRQSGLSLLQLPWKIDEDNQIRFGQGRIYAENFALTNKERKIRIRNKGEKGLTLQFDHFNFNFIDQLWEYDPLDFSGDFDLLLQVDDIFKMTGINATMSGNDFYINKDDFGKFRLDVNTPDLKSQVTAFLQLESDSTKLELDATYNLGDLVASKAQQVKNQKDYLNMRLLFNGFPLSIAEYWLKNGLKNTHGSFDAALDISGLTSNLDLDGFIDAKDGGFTIDPLKTHYTFKKGLINASSDFFDLSNTVIYDKYGNQAVMEGGITHQNLRYLGLDARLSTNRFLGLDLKEGDNDIFYGKALGAGEVVFSGNFIRPNIYVNATVADSTRIIIPITDQGESKELDFVDFVNKHQVVQRTESSVDTKVNGLDLEMDLGITEVADLEMIFDEQAGDILRGKGRGNLRILLPRGEDFQMYGDITVSKGNYLFTLLDVINKDFRILPGGTISWLGDPLEALINIQAEYKDLKSSLSSFIPEYLLNADDDIKSAARQATDVNLVLDLEGELFKPDISFDLSFPNLQGTLANLSDNKLNLLRRDQNEMNKQVFGLIVLGQFIPSDLSFSGNEVLVNTVSEYFSNQLSLLFTDLVSEFVGEGKTISSLDVEVGYNQINDNATRNQNQNDQVVDVFLKSGILNERVTIGVGANVTWGQTAQNSAFIGENVIIELAISKNRDFKLRFYERRDQDIGGGRRIQAGTGVSWRKEFDSFHAFWESLKQNK